MATKNAPAFPRVSADPQGGPLYRSVKRALLASIEDGGCAPGSALPNERTLAGAFGVSIGTIRRAVDELVADQILSRQQGRGTFVAVHNASRFLFQFFHIERCDGQRDFPKVELLSFERGRAEEDAASALRLAPGDPVIRIENRLLLQGRPVGLDRLTLSAQMFRGLTERRFAERSSTIYHLYQTAFGITVTRAAERARALLADRGDARILGVPVGTALIQVRRTAMTFGDRPVEYRVSVINTAQHEYVHLLSRPGQA